MQTLSVTDEYTVVLPQRVRVGVVGIAAHTGGSFLILLRDFVRRGTESPVQASERLPQNTTLEPIWRLFRYVPPERVSRELCVFRVPADEPTPDVHLAACEAGVFVLFANQLLEVDLNERAVCGSLRLQLSSEADEVARVRGLAVGCSDRNERVLALTLDLGDDRMSLHVVPGGEGPALSGPYSGARGERLAFGADGDLYAFDLMDITRYRDARPVASRDVSAFFGAWYETPAELLTLTTDGRVIVGSGSRIMALSADLEQILGLWELPMAPDSLVWSGATDQLVMVRSDAVQAALRLSTARL